MLTTSYETYRRTQIGKSGENPKRKRGKLCGKIRRKQNYNTVILVLKYFLFSSFIIIII